MKPYRRPVLHPNYGCVAIDIHGKRCARRHYTEYPITFTWDPIKGVGVLGPNAPFCRMHGYVWELEASERVEIVGGWIGRGWNPDAKCWTATTTVYDDKYGLYVSTHWWAMRRTATFGDCSRVLYDDAVAALDTPAVAV